MNPAIAFGKILKRIRKEKEISQEKLSNACNLDRTYISLIERGLRQPSLKTIFKIANALNLPPSKLIFFTEGLFFENNEDRISDKKR